MDSLRPNLSVQAVLRERLAKADANPMSATAKAQVNALYSLLGNRYMTKVCPLYLDLLLTTEVSLDEENVTASIKPGLL